MLGGRPGTARHLAVINLSAVTAQGRISLPWPDLSGRSWNLADLLNKDAFDRHGDELTQPGLFVDLRPWQSYLFAVR